MSESQYNRYLNICVFAKSYRKYKQESAKKDFVNFTKEMQKNEYVLSEFYDNETKRPVFIYLFNDKDDKYTSKSEHIKMLLSKIKQRSEVILITKTIFKPHFTASFNLFDLLTISTYLEEKFNDIMPESPLCGKHRILTDKEVDIVCETFHREPHHFPKILISDTQCIWLGAKIGDMIEIINYSKLSGLYISYRTVIADDEKRINFNEKNNLPEDSEAEEFDSETEANSSDTEESSDSDATE